MFSVYPRRLVALLKNYELLSNDNLEEHFVVGILLDQLLIDRWIHVNRSLLVGRLK